MSMTMQQAVEDYKAKFPNADVKGYDGTITITHDLGFKSVNLQVVESTDKAFKVIKPTKRDERCGIAYIFIPKTHCNLSVYGSMKNNGVWITGISSFIAVQNRIF